jgi:hypothetical protein
VIAGRVLRGGGWQDAGDDEDGNSKSKEKRRKRKEKERQEQLVKEKEAKLLDAKHAPETAEEFERLVMSSPNSSFIWIKYMAFHLELTEIDKAREVCVQTCVFVHGMITCVLICVRSCAHPCVQAHVIIRASMRPCLCFLRVACLLRLIFSACASACECVQCACMRGTDSTSSCCSCAGHVIKLLCWMRHARDTSWAWRGQVSERALKTINFREEQEKLNVWVARLNLENLYGSRETLMNKFEEACKLNDAKKMHMQLLAIFEKNGEAQVTEHFFKTLTRKFRSSCKVRFPPLFVSLPRSLAPAHSQ